MSFGEYLPFWNKLTPQQQERVSGAVDYLRVKQGTLLHDSQADCLGLLVIRTGQLRAFFMSAEGREITLYRLLDHDVCMLSASCAMPDMQFDVQIEAEKDSEFWSIPACLYKNLMDESLVVANYAHDLITNHFSELMWLMEQIMWKSFDKRLAAFLVEESGIEGTTLLKVTHEKIANHMGTAREVVTRMLRYFQGEGLVKLSRGTIEITDAPGLRALQDD